MDLNGTSQEQTAFDVANANYATFGVRLGALIIDQVLLMVVGFVLGFIIGIIYAAAGNSSMDELQVFCNIVGVVLSWLYYATCESSQAQATIGKSICKIKVVGSDGERISFGRATGRYFGKIISGIALLIGYLSVLWHPQRRAWHDSMANTYVVMK